MRPVPTCARARLLVAPTLARLGPLLLALLSAPALAIASSRVVHGIGDTDEPAVAAIAVRDTDGSLVQDCSGTLIGCRHVLTAAHCVCHGDYAEDCPAPDPSRFVVFLPSGGLYDVEAVELSSDYEFAVRDDVAVLRLEQAVERIVPETINTARRVPVGTVAKVAGFGSTADGANDAGLLRSGSVVTTPCPDDVPDRRHVCWRFDTAEGAAASASATCYGDSGGPLFADVGAGRVVAGIDSGFDGRCVRNTHGFDTSVFDVRYFIAGVAGDDLGTERCGEGLAHVGDPGSQVTVLSGSLGFAPGPRRCRRKAAAAASAWWERVLDGHRRCLDARAAGDPEHPCARADAIQAKADRRLQRSLTGRACNAEAVQSAGLRATCQGAAEDAGLAACLVVEADSAISALLETTHGAGPVLPPALAACREATAGAASDYAKAQARSRLVCRRLADRGPDRGCLAAEIDAAEQRARQRLSQTVASACDEAEVAALVDARAFGEPCDAVADRVELIDCLGAAAALAATEMAQVWAPSVFEDLVVFDVSPGTTLLRVSLAGTEDYGGVFHLSAAAGRTPTSGAPSSTLASPFQTLEIATPTAGPWYAHIGPGGAPGSTVGAWQLTVTAFTDP